MTTTPPTAEFGHHARPPAAMAGDDDLGTAHTTTPLDELSAELNAELEQESEPVPVPSRPGYAVVFALDIDHHLLSQWRKRATDRSLPGQFDELKWGLTILAAQTRRIIRRDQPVEIDGVPVDFRSRPFQELLGVGRHIDAVRKFYGRDAHVISAAMEVLRLAGYGDEVAQADPTGLSSND